MTLTREQRQARKNALSRAYRFIHRERLNTYNRAYYSKHPEQARGRNLRNDFGITIADYNTMFAAQGGKCAVCGRHYPKTLHVDHDHITGKVRGLLCPRCNRGLGLFFDDPEILTSAAHYLTFPPGRDAQEVENVAVGMECTGAQQAC